MSNFKIRAHHGLCIRFFEGVGYSDEFIKNMADIVNRLSDNPVIEIIRDEDLVCKCCPNNINGSCKDNSLVLSYDKRVLEECNLKSGISIHWDEYQKIIDKNIIKTNKLQNICIGCQWIDICKSKIN